MSGSGEIRTCKHCGNPFMATDGRQRFCPPPYGIKESLCGIAHREAQNREGGNKSTRLFIPPDLHKRLCKYQKIYGKRNKMDAMVKLIEDGLKFYGL